MNIQRFTGCRRSRFAWLAALAVLAGAGCLQVDTRIKIGMDGGATITERVQLSRGLLDLSKMQEGGVNIEAFLSKEHVQKRVEQMGKGAKLVRHELRDAEQGARECVSVITIPDLNDLRYTSPFLANGYPTNSVLRFGLTPCYQSPHYGLWPGEMALRVWPEARKSAPNRPKREGAPAGPAPRTPADLQVFRDLRPVFRDALQGFRVRLVVESYDPIGLARGYYYYRGQRAATREYDLIDFSWKDFDQSGREFLDNEEIMLELLRFQFSGGNLMATVREHPNNMTVPVYHGGGIPPITFRPSRQLFDRHFEGKKLIFGPDRGGTRTANFKEIGVRENAAEDKNKKPQQDKTP